MAKIIVVDQERCLGCKTCVIECAMAHSNARNLAEAISAESGEPAPQPRVHVEPLGAFGMPLQCRHCEDAPCITVCPTEAIHRYSETGPVVLDQDRCIGCKFCLLVCPFGVIDVSRDGKAMIKCDLCIERTEAGEEPACVAGCPTKALQFRDVEDYLRERRRRAAENIDAGTARALHIAAEGDDER